MRANDVHVYHTSREDHNTNGLDCWCEPRYLLPCDECEKGCWKCTDGNIPLSRARAGTIDPGERIIIVHHP